MRLCKPGKRPLLLNYLMKVYPFLLFLRRESLPCKISKARSEIKHPVCYVLFVFQEVGLLEEVISPRSNLPPLLLKLSERPAEQLDYLGVSYGLTAQLLRYVA